MIRPVRHSARFRLLCAAAWLALVSQPALAAGATVYRTFRPAGVPVAFELPGSWSSSAPAPPTLFFAADPNQRAYADLTVTKTSLSFARFTALYVAKARKFNLAQDPKATTRARAVILPAGRAELIVSSFHQVGGHGNTLLLAAFSYGLLHGGRAYSFTYVCVASDVPKYVPIIEHSAASIRFAR